MTPIIYSKNNCGPCNVDKQIKVGEMVFVKVGKMAGTYAVVSSVQDKFVYLRHLVTNIEFRCKIGDVA